MPRDFWHARQVSYGRAGKVRLTKTNRSCMKTSRSTRETAAMSRTIDLKVPGTRNRVPVRTTGQWRSRFLGLAGARELKKSCGVWVKRCSSVNTFGFDQPVDVVFLSADGVVTKIV